MCSQISSTPWAKLPDQSWRHWLFYGQSWCFMLILGHPCTVLTDHTACLSMLNTPHPSTKLARWTMWIQELHLEIKHRSGQSNASTDALLRHPVNGAMVCSVTGEGLPIGETEESVRTDTLILSEDTQQKFSELSELQQSCPDLKPICSHTSQSRVCQKMSS